MAKCDKQFVLLEEAISFFWRRFCVLEPKSGGLKLNQGSL
jgi:hypothetical protein